MRAAALVGLLEAVVILVIVPHGVDYWAHKYALFVLTSRHPSIWNPMWYRGSYIFVGYSIVPYLLATVVGFPVVEILAIGLALLAAVTVYGDERYSFWRWTFIAFSLTWPLTLFSGAIPYVLGVGLASWALVFYLRSWYLPFLLAITAVFLSSPLALLFLGLLIYVHLCGTVLQLSWGSSQWWRGIMRAALKRWFTPFYALAALSLGFSRAFPSPAHYPFFGSDLAFIGAATLSVIITLLLWAPRSLLRQSIIFGGILYLGASLVTFPVPSVLGANIARLSEFAAPMVVLTFTAMSGQFAKRWGGKKSGAFMGTIAVVLGIYIPWGVNQVDGPLLYSNVEIQGTPQYWSPVVRFLKKRLEPGQRVEVVDSPLHASAYFLAATGIPLMRGWYRQDDFPQDSLLYSGAISQTRYNALLTAAGVAYVVLPPPPYDFSAVSEANLVHKDAPDLLEVFRRGGLRVYALQEPSSLVRGAKVVSFGFSAMGVDFPRGGRYRLEMNFSPYYLPSVGCIHYVAPGVSSWWVPKAGRATLRFQFHWSKMVSEIVSNQNSACGP